MSNVLLIDPNTINTNSNIINSVPQYQDMFIFAELIASRKGRTVMSNGEGIATDEKVTVNFMGINQNTNDPNNLNFTTNYYDGSTGNNVQYEGFGISSIKVVINSSFIPQVSIQFVDVRGLAFFNQEKSPYRILIDFPPPLFNLTIKGYYGKSLTYKLHLVKYTSEFKAENGNYIIDANFVAVTYAPLTDVLLRYVINFPLMPSQNDGSISFTSNPNEPPKNTYALILKLKNLYDEIATKLKSLPESESYDKTLNRLGSITDTLSLLGDYRERLGGGGVPYLVTINNSPTLETSSYPFNISNDTVTASILVPNSPTVVNIDNIMSITNFSEYDKIIESFATSNIPTNVSQRFYILYYAGRENKIPYAGIDSVNNNQKIRLDGFKNELIKSYNNIGLVNSSSVGIPTVSFTNSFDILTLINDTNAPRSIYIGLDISDFYIKLYKERNSLTQTKTDLANSINTIINNIIMDKLGMMPTVYNIFKIILDDVDTFFKTIRKTSNDAEAHHNDPSNKQKIINNYYRDIIPKTTSENIYSFPLVTDTQTVSGGLGDKEVRVAPIKLSKLLTNPFPELQLVERFIQTFNLQEQISKLMNQKAEINEDGSFKWIPISPLDSKLADIGTESPYIDIDTISGAVNISQDTRLVQVLKIVLNRFYILSQSSYPASFYSSDSNISNGYTNFYAESEAVNLANSVTETKYSANLKTNALSFGKDISSFYKFLSETTSISDHYYFDKTEKIAIPLLKDSDGYVYTYKSNSNYVGSVIVNEPIVLQKPSGDKASTKPVDVFQNTILKTSFWNRFKRTRAQAFYNFTDENLIFIKDAYLDKNGEIDSKEAISDKDSVNINTRFVTDEKKLNVNNKDFIDLVLNSGNIYFPTSKIAPIPAGANSLKTFGNITTSWISQLSYFDTEIYGTIISGTSYNLNLSALLFLSNFGYTLSPFNLYPSNLNGLIFNIAGVMEVPAFLPAYIGALVYAIEGTDPNFTIQIIQDFFTTGDGKNLTSSGLFIFADIHDIKNYLSEKDKQTYKAEFDRFKNLAYAGILTGVQNMYKEVNDFTKDKFIKIEKYTTYLDPNPSNTTTDAGKYYNIIISPLIARINILNFSEITFSSNMGSIGYTSINELNSTNKKTINDNYFKLFFNKLANNLTSKDDELNKQETDNNKLKGDEDIVTQTYYSFKNINDKWLTNPKINNTGYPSNENGKSLIEHFAFVDRAMNPIADTIINVESLIDMFNDPNISVFSALSQLLSSNGFEFFPLQNLMSYTQDSWEKSFKIDVNIDNDSQAAFVCMLIGGTSSYPSGISNGFTDDGIINLEYAPKDFNVKSPFDQNGKILISEGTDDYKQVSGFKNFPWSLIRAFRVRFGEQNQSMFTDFKIDSKEFPETNESIQILARLAGDNKVQSPIPKGQNLYNVYENRAYKATITALGNAMIQPTQYFQIENVPVFNGAYLILSVEHDISPNKMTTTFAGTKILQYPVPRVLNAAAIMGFEGGNSSSTSINNNGSVTTPTNNPNPNASTSLVPVSGYEQLNAPVDPQRVVLTSPYGTPRHRKDNTDYGHQGVDLAGLIGVEIWAVKKGTIEVKKTETDTNGNVAGYGKYIIINHGTGTDGNKLYTLYGHLSEWADIEEKNTVEAGAVIGWLGNTGHGTGPHLHFEVRVGVNDNSAEHTRDPELYLKTSMKSVWTNYPKK